eukprot:gene26963-biopygen17537
MTSTHGPPHGAIEREQPNRTHRTNERTRPDPWGG